MPHQERPDAGQGRVVVRELRTDRPVPRRVAAERHPAGDAPGVRGDDPPVHDREVVRRVHDDETGGDWRVFERDARLIPGSRGPRCLYFDGEGIVRRVWQYPSDWSSLPPTALLALMDRPPLGDR